MNDNPIKLSLGNFLASKGKDPLQAPLSFTKWMQMQAIGFAAELYEPEMLSKPTRALPSHLTGNGAR